MENSLQRWKERTNSDDELTRIEALDDIPEDYPQEVSEQLIEMLRDDSELVRQAAAEALADFDNQSARDALRACILSEKDHLVREYAISSLGVVANLNDLRFIIELLESENNPEVLIHIYTGIAVASRNIASRELLSRLSSDDPILKSSSLNALLFSFLDFDLNEIIEVLSDEMKNCRDNEEIANAYSRFLKLQESLGTEPDFDL